MKYFLISSLLAALAVPVSAADIYTCTDRRGNKIYTQDADSPGCRKADVGRPSVYSSLPAKPVAAAPQAGQAASDSGGEEAYAAARQRVADAQKALEEGKKIRYGNERNYARYLNRIAGLEAEVQKAQDDLDKVRDKADTAEAGAVQAQ